MLLTSSHSPKPIPPEMPSLNRKDELLTALVVPGFPLLTFFQGNQIMYCAE